jgi:hypothetical protein
MHTDGFKDILEEFPATFDGVKPLCRELRDVVGSKISSKKKKAGWSRVTCNRRKDVAASMLGLDIHAKGSKPVLLTLLIVGRVVD